LDTGHLNYAGALKMSVHMGQYLKDNYNLEDKRAVAEYQAWNERKQDYYIEHLGVETHTQAQTVQCELIGAEGIVGNYTYEYMLYQDGEKLLQSERMTETEYTFDSLTPGEYRVRVALYDADGNQIRRFYNQDKAIVE